MEQQKQYPRAMQSYVYMLYEFVLEYRPKKMLEIGVQNGQSTKTILMAMNEIKFGKLVSIDHKRRESILDQNHADLKEYWHFIQGNSHAPETFQAAKDALEEGEQYDMLFIDGDHKYPGVKNDFEEYTRLVKPGGIILLHDITNQNEGVRDLWNEILWDKFGITWGRARNNVVPGFGIVRKPLEGEEVGVYDDLIQQFMR
jgi:predicted O-methyltransferase YrrM